MQDFCGVYSAVFTPYGKDGKFDAAMFEQTIAFQARNGLRGLYVGGSSGEGPMQRVSERIKIARCAIELCREHGLKSIIHIGHCSTDLALEMARSAEESGADAISSVQPYYYLFNTDQRENYYLELVDKVALPLIMYSYRDNLTTASLQSMLKLLSNEKIIGMKYTGNDFFMVSSLFNRLPDEKLFFSGSDQHMIAGLSYGSCGSIGLYQNSLPGVFSKLYDAFRSGDFDSARQYQMRINTLIDCVKSFGDFSYVKAIMRYIGMDCGCFRPPFKQLNDNEYSQLAKKLEQFDDLFALNL